MRTILPLLAALILAVPALASAQAPAASAAPESKPLDLAVKLPNGVTLHPDITYSTVRGVRPLTLDLYVPAKAGPKPLVVYLHGGSWVGGARREANLGGGRTWELLSKLAARGYVVASLSYRLSGEARYPAPIQDLNAALRLLKANAGRWGINPAKIVTWGASAGAQVVINQALDCQTRAFDAEPKAAPVCPVGVVDWYGPADFAAPFDSPVIVAYLGCERAACADQYRKAGGVHLVTDKAPPFVLVHGDSDTTVPLAHSQRLAAALKAKGRSANLHVVKGAEHGFRGATPAELAGAIKASFDFIDAQTR